MASKSVTRFDSGDTSPSIPKVSEDVEPKLEAKNKVAPSRADEVDEFRLDFSLDESETQQQGDKYLDGLDALGRRTGVVPRT